MYEFLYRAISDYVDLYNSKDAEYEYSVPVGAVQANGTTKVRDNRTWDSVKIICIAVGKVNPVNQIFEV